MIDDKIKVMLIFPPVTRPQDFSAEKVRISPFVPLGLAYLGAELEKAGRFEVNMLDALIEGDLNGAQSDNGNIRYGLSDKEIQDKIKQFSPDVVAVSCLFAAMENDAINVFAIAKNTNKEIITVMGGANASSAGQHMIENKECDYVIVGEGERTFIELLNAINNKNTDLKNIDGLMYKQGGTIHVNPKISYIANLDSIPFPARHLLPMEKYFSVSLAHSSYKNKPFTPMITSRGCPAKCTFCALANHWGKKQRKRSAKNVLDEIESLIREYNIREIHFEDDNLTADKTRALEIFEGMIERKFNISWTVPSGMAVFSLDEGLLVKMKQSGCYSVSLAIENANQEILTNIMKKPVNLQKVKPLVDKIRSLDMDVRGFFIIGYPGETKGNMEQTINYARELELDWAYFFIFSPLPGTSIYKTCIDKGYLKEGDFDPLRSFHQSVIKTPEFDQEYLKELRERAIIDVNFANNVNLLKYNVDRAIVSFQQVLSIYPHFDFANYYLGIAYLKKGEPERAAQLFRKTLELNPNHQAAKDKLAESIKQIHA